MVNGAKRALAGGTMLGGVQPADKYGEMQFRQTLTAVERMLKAQGGGSPIVDPIGFLTLGLVMDKLNELSSRLVTIENIVSNPFFTGDAVTIAKAP